jgi:hypothetical protein
MKANLMIIALQVDYSSNDEMNVQVADKEHRHTLIEQY